MASVVPVKAIVEALAAALRQITVANDYNTDLGLNVLTERSQQQLPSGPRCTVAVYQKQRVQSGNARPAPGRAIRGVIEVEYPASYENALLKAYEAEEDIDRLLSDVYTQMPNALPVEYEEAIFLDKPEGLPVVGFEVHWTTGYRRNG